MDKHQEAAAPEHRPAQTQKVGAAAALDAAAGAAILPTCLLCSLASE